MCLTGTVILAGILAPITFVLREGRRSYFKQKTCLGHVLRLCPFVDLFRTTFPEIRGNRAQKDYLFTNLIENCGIVKNLEFS